MAQTKKRSSIKKTTPRKKPVKKSGINTKTALKAAAFLGTVGVGTVAAVQAKKKYDSYKKTAPSSPSYYDNFMSFLGFNSKPANVDTCQKELTILKEELNNAKKNDNGVNQCNDELNKIQKELENSKEELDNYRTYRILIEKEVTDLQNKLNQTIIDINGLENKVTGLEQENHKLKRSNNALGQEIDAVKRQNAVFQKKLVTGR